MTNASNGTQKRGGNPAKFDSILHVGLTPAMAEALEQIAADNLETVSAASRRALLIGIRYQGYLPAPNQNVEAA